MKKEYDFSKGERGKFYTPDAKINLPIYLESENLVFVENVAKKKQLDLTTVVNELIRRDIQIVNAVS